MCAISGVLSTKYLSPINSTEVFKTMLQRGPDATGKLLKNQSALFHSLLKMQDPSLRKSQQPVVSDSGNYALIFNGEIYNWAQLDPEKKYSSEAAFLINTWEQKGSDLFSNLRGTYAIAIISLKNPELFLIRDRHGEKPLYIKQEPDNIVFASRIATIEKLSPGLQLNRNVLAEVLQYRYNPSLNTIFDGVECVEPGYIYHFKIEQTQINRNKSLLPEYSRGDENLEEALKNATQLQLGSIHHPTLLLSGGVDSQMLAALVETSATPFYFEGFSTPDELKSVKRMCARKNWQLQTVIANPAKQDLRTIVIKTQEILDEPILDFSLVPIALLAEQISKTSSLVLVGDGADEIFAGYIHHKVLHFWEKIKTFAPKWLLAIALNLSRRSVGLLQFLPTGYGKKLGPEAFLRLLSILEKNLTTEFYEAPDLLALFSSEELKSLGLRSQAASVMRWRSLTELRDWEKKHWLPKYSIERIERVFMSYSVEARMPYLDPGVVRSQESQTNFFTLTNNKAPLRLCAEKYLSAEAWSPKKPFVGDPADYFAQNEKIILQDLQHLQKFEINISPELYKKWSPTFLGRKKIFALWSLSLFILAHGL